MRPVETDDIIIEFDGKTCIHARKCVLGLPGVFKPATKGPGSKGGWIFPQGVASADLTRVIEACPSGALRYTRKDDKVGELAPQVNTARLLENGPLEIHADLHMPDDAPRLRATLCRCGKSQNKPYCDNEHLNGFVATAEPVASDQTNDLEQPNGPVTVTVVPHGPLIVTGPLEVISGQGHQISTNEKHFLCRCGASQNKPFCDGSHKEAGFEAE